MACLTAMPVALQAGELPASKKSFEQGLEIRRRLAEAEPGDAQAQRGLMISHYNLGQLAMAGMEFRD